MKIKFKITKKFGRVISTASRKSFWSNWLSQVSNQVLAGIIVGVILVQFKGCFNERRPASITVIIPVTLIEIQTKNENTEHHLYRHNYTTAQQPNKNSKMWKFPSRLCRAGPSQIFLLSQRDVQGVTGQTGGWPRPSLRNSCVLRNRGLMGFYWRNLLGTVTNAVNLRSANTP